MHAVVFVCMRKCLFRLTYTHTHVRICAQKDRVHKNCLCWLNLNRIESRIESCVCFMQYTSTLHTIHTREHKNGDRSTTVLSSGVHMGTVVFKSKRYLDFYANYFSSNSSIITINRSIRYIYSNCSRFLLEKLFCASPIQRKSCVRYCYWSIIKMWVKFRKRERAWVANVQVFCYIVYAIHLICMLSLHHSQNSPIQMHHCLCYTLCAYTCVFARAYI